MIVPKDKMVIYQVHEFCNYYGEYCDDIIGSYLIKERADKEKLRAEENHRKEMELGTIWWKAEFRIEEVEVMCNG